MSASWRLDSGFVYAILRVHAHDFDLDFDFDFDFEFEFEFEISLFAFQKRSRRVFLFSFFRRFAISILRDWKVFSLLPLSFLNLIPIHF